MDKRGCQGRGFSETQKSHVKVMKQNGASMTMTCAKVLQQERAQPAWGSQGAWSVAEQSPDCWTLGRHAGVAAVTQLELHSERIRRTKGLYDWRGPFPMLPTNYVADFTGRSQASDLIASCVTVDPRNTVFTWPPRTFTLSRLLPHWPFPQAP